MTYKPGMAHVGQATPQSAPEKFSDAEIRAEIAHLIKLNKRHGSHHLRTAAYVKLQGVLREREAATAK